jgi:hypothetical protein
MQRGISALTGLAAGLLLAFALPAGTGATDATEMADIAGVANIGDMADIANPTEMARLGRDFWAWRAVGQPISGDDVPRIERPAGWAPDWSAGAVAARRRELEGFAERWRALSGAGLTVPEQVDYRLLGSALARVRWELDGVRLWRRDPSFYLAQTLGSLVDALLPPPPFDAARSGDILARLAAFPRLLADGRANLDQAVQPFARLAIDSLDGVGGIGGIGPRLRQATAALRPLLDAPSRPRLDAATAAAVAALESYRSWLQSRAAGMTGEVAVGRDAYLAFLREVALLPYTPEQIIAMGRQEWARSVAAEALEAQRNRGLPELPIFATQEEQIARARRDELALRSFLERRGVLSVPDWMPHYAYRPLPAYLAPLADFGEGTDFPLRRRPGEEATRYIPLPSPDLGYFALSMARDPRADMVHEGIPGHGFQLALARRQDDELRRHWYDSAVNEGLGFYCEEMMLSLGLFDDSPRTREMIWNYARLRALRVEVDVRLALGTFTIEQAADYLRAAVPMDLSTARAEAASFAAAPGFAIGYQIGKLQIVRLLAEARLSQGARFDLRAFDDFVWRNGNVPLVLQRWELLGRRDEIDALDALDVLDAGPLGRRGNGGDRGPGAVPNGPTGARP